MRSKEPSRRTSFACRGPRKAFALAAALAVLLAGAACSREKRAGRLVQEGRKLLAVRDIQGAIARFQQAVQTAPMNPEARYRLALANLAVGNSRVAAEELAKAIQLKPDHWPAQVKLAELMATSSDPRVLAAAQAKLTAAIGHLPGDAGAIAALSVVEWKLGRRDDAERRLERALAELPPAPGAVVVLAKMKMAAGDRSGAETLLRQSASRGNAEATIALAEFYTATRRYAEAEAELRRALACDPSNGAALLDLAVLQLAGNRPADAAATYRALAALPDRRYRPLYGMFLLETGQARLAAAEFERVWKLDPSDNALRTGLVTAYLAAGHEAEAEQLLRTAVRRKNPDYEALFQNAILNLGEERVQEAQANILAALRLRPEAAEAHYVLAAVYLRSAQVLSSVEQLGQALQRNPGFLPARIELARYQIASKAPDVAADLLARAPERARASSRVAAERCWALLAMGDRERFGSELEAARRRGTTPTLEVEGALALLERDPAAAGRIAADLLRANPEDMRALLLMARSRAVEAGPEAAIESAGQYAESHPRLAQAWHFLGELLLAHRQLPEAIAALETAMAAGARTPALESAAARAELRAGNAALAETRLAPVTAADPANYGARFLLGVAQQMRGEYKDAARSYRRVLDVVSEDVPALYNLAYLLAEHRGNPEEALQLAEKARELAPESAAVDDVFGWVLHRRGLNSLAAIHLAEAAAAGSARAASDLAAVRAGKSGPAPGASPMPDPIAHGWIDLSASENTAARLEAYQRTRGCEPDAALMDAVLTERDAKRFTARAIVPLMLCEPRPQLAAASLSPLQTSLDTAAGQWTDPNAMLQAVFSLSGLDLPDTAGWDNTLVSWDSGLKTAPRDITPPPVLPHAADSFSLRPPLDRPDEAGWNVYDSIWPKSFR